MTTNEQDVGVEALDIDPNEDEPNAGRNAFEWLIVVVSAVVFALLLRTFVLAAFWIPSASMEPTLEIKDRVLVNKLSYSVGDVKRGDIIVIEREEVTPGQTKDLIKRVVALSGETVEIRDDQVFVDGDPVDESEYLGDDVPENEFGPEKIPEGHVFVLGDNRPKSDDSSGSLGPIRESQIVGKAFVRFWPIDRVGGVD